jgi:mRNA interferase YafQ
MRTIEQSTQFKRDLRREAKGQYRSILSAEFTGIVRLLALDQLIAEKYRDHPLSGEWRDHRDCHVRPDLLLIYSKPNADVLRLVRLGSHSELGL